MAAKIRPAQPLDGPLIWRLLRQFATSYSPDESVFASTFPSLLSERGCVFLVIESDGFLSGYLIAYVLPTLFANGPIMNIVELVVDEARRGEGLGKALVSHIAAVAWERGCIETVVPTRRATGFYEKLGFKQSAHYLKLSRS